MKKAAPLPGKAGTAETSFSAIDEHFARLMERLAGRDSPSVKLAAKLVSHARSLGHICFPLDGGTAGLPDEVQALPELPGWVGELRASSVVGAPGEFAPLILDAANRLYLRRYWEYEQRLCANLEQRMGAARPVIDAAALREVLTRYFPRAGAETDWQKLAAFVALTRNFCIISGGPGTGKTRTVVRILAALLSLREGAPLRIALTAPTGKAAARLKEAIKQGRAKLPPEVQAGMPQDATTIHRLLGSLPDSPYFRHHARAPLAVDVVVVDEASMVDLALMAKLVDAVPPGARLILLGDKDQLTSVEAGAVLGDLCRSGTPIEPAGTVLREYEAASDETVHFAGTAPVAPIHESIVELRRNYRFTGTGGIAALSTLANAGDADGVVEFLKRGDSAEACGTLLPSGGRLVEALRAPLLAGYGSYLADAEPQAVLAAFERFRVLCALRHGPFGVQGLNAAAEQILTEAGLLVRQSTWYRGRPVMVTRNDYNLRLFNGDVGVTLPDPAAGGELRVFFTTADGSLRRFLPSRLPSHETVFAMTVHKSQGSEFDEVLLVLPDADSPVVTRELVYTALTRARRRVEVWYREAALRQGILRQTRRTSGLRDTLWRDAVSR